MLTGGPRQPLNLQLVPVGPGRRASLPIEQRRHLPGLFRYLADAPSLQLCAGGDRLPVAMEGDYLRLQRAYLRAQPPGAAGQPMLVNLEGLITQRPSAEPGRGSERTLVVDRFVSVHPGQACPQGAPSGHPDRPPMAQLPLRGTLWGLQALQSSEGPRPIEPPDRPAELQLAADTDRLGGSGGCNRLMGGFQLSGGRLRFSRLASTPMACPAAVMAFERRYVQALGQVGRWSIDKANLLLQDERGRTLLLFTAVR
ncbi:META domain-containing protein [Cyanobium sp. FGCU-52]|nr:META domain-containing protein [Cyanobium sp. FGCU52]